MSGSRCRNSRGVRASRYVTLLHKSRYIIPNGTWWTILTGKSSPSSALIGTVEELSASQQTMNLVRDQFEINYFGPLNIIKAALPHMRREHAGHIMILSGISKGYSLPRVTNTVQDNHLIQHHSGAYRYTRSRHVLRSRMGTRRILRREQSLFLSQLPLYKLRNNTTNSN